MSEIEWRGDLEDDCSARLGVYEAHCEALCTIKWRDVDSAGDRPVYSHADLWYVGVHPVDDGGMVNGPALFHSGEHGGMITGGDMARGIAEAVLRAANDTNQAHK